MLKPGLPEIAVWSGPRNEITGCQLCTINGTRRCVTPSSPWVIKGMHRANGFDDEKTQWSGLMSRKRFQNVCSIISHPALLERRCPPRRIPG